MTRARTVGNYRHDNNTVIQQGLGLDGARKDNRAVIAHGGLSSTCLFVIDGERSPRVYRDITIEARVSGSSEM